ncbi:hypothetical protein CDAR_479291 [Caerostris darwini]|uniref:Uncharacterized protein n=1 Tax=Caerostris darwini TaxID=1538125 RepID=A0AAV4UW67_9ARAC|nr:hypothetical protein CDAR_479291 [Caerostris darwini]
MSVKKPIRHCDLGGCGLQCAFVHLIREVENSQVCEEIEPIRYCDLGGCGLQCAPVHLVRETRKDLNVPKSLFGTANSFWESPLEVSPPLGLDEWGHTGDPSLRDRNA